jgi:hypothetical protein
MPSENGLVENLKLSAGRACRAGNRPAPVTASVAAKNFLRVVILQTPQVGVK